MRTIFPMLALAGTCVLTGNPAGAQTQDPARVAEFQNRFQQGYDLQTAGRLAEARAVYDGILAEEPKAKRSLLEAGRVSLGLLDYPKADDYLTRLHTLEPNFPEATELLIQANEALQREVKVERLIKEFRALHDGGTIPGFSGSPSFVREVIHGPAGGRTVMTQFFNYRDAPNIAFILESLDAAGQIQRQAMLGYNPEATADLRAKDPKMATVEDFILVENVIGEGKVKKVEAYQQFLALPDYPKLRAAMLGVLKGTGQPVYSAPVPATPHP